MSAEAQRTRDTIAPPTPAAPGSELPSEMPPLPVPPRPTAAPRRSAATTSGSESSDAGTGPGTEDPRPVPPASPAPTVPQQTIPAPRNGFGPPPPDAPPRPAPVAVPGRSGGPTASLFGAAAPEAPAAPAPVEPGIRGWAGIPRAGLGRAPVRAAAICACLVLGLGLLGGAVTGAVLHGDETAAPDFGEARSLWHTLPVDTIFPRTVYGEDAGPGKADRTWTRIAVAPDSDCTGAFDPLLAKALSPAGCERLLRATYTDATSSSVTTVGLLVTETDPRGMRALQRRFGSEGLQERTDLVPRPYPAQGTPAAGFGPGQRASWTIRVLTDVPMVVYAVSGFADGRKVSRPEPAAEATVPGAGSAAAQSGLGHDASGIADRIERGLRKSTGPAAEDTP